MCFLLSSSIFFYYKDICRKNKQSSATQAPESVRITCVLSESQAQTTDWPPSPPSDVSIGFPLRESCVYSSMFLIISSSPAGRHLSWVSWDDCRDGLTRVLTLSCPLVAKNDPSNFKVSYSKVFIKVSCIGPNHFCISWETNPFSYQSKWSKGLSHEMNFLEV